MSYLEAFFERPPEKMVGGTSSVTDATSGAVVEFTVGEDQEGIAQVQIVGQVTPGTLSSLGAALGSLGDRWQSGGS